MSQLLRIDERNFADTTLASPVPVLIDFTAPWCPPCRAIAPLVHAVADAYGGRLLVGTCDADENPALAARFQIRSLPTLILLKEGRVVGHVVGAVPLARIEALVETALDLRPDAG